MPELSIVPYREPAKLVTVAPKKKRSWWWRRGHKKVLRLIARRDELVRSIAAKEQKLKDIGGERYNSRCWIRQASPDDRDANHNKTLAGYRREAEFDNLVRDLEREERGLNGTKDKLEEISQRHPDLFEEE